MGLLLAVDLDLDVDLRLKDEDVDVRLGHRGLHRTTLEASYTIENAIRKRRKT